MEYLYRFGPGFWWRQVANEEALAAKLAGGGGEGRVLQGQAEGRVWEAANGWEVEVSEVPEGRSLQVRVYSGACMTALGAVRRAAGIVVGRQFAGEARCGVCGAGCVPGALH
jgi:hypothetical protein